MPPHRAIAAAFIGHLYAAMLCLAQHLTRTVSPGISVAQGLLGVNIADELFMASKKPGGGMIQCRLRQSINVSFMDFGATLSLAPAKYLICIKNVIIYCIPITI